MKITLNPTEQKSQSEREIEKFHKTFKRNFKASLDGGTQSYKLKTARVSYIIILIIIIVVIIAIVIIIITIGMIVMILMIVS